MIYIHDMDMVYEKGNEYIANRKKREKQKKKKKRIKNKTAGRTARVYKINMRGGPPNYYYNYY